VSLSTDGLLDELAILRAENAYLRRKIAENEAHYRDRAAVMQRAHDKTREKLGEMIDDLRRQLEDWRSGRCTYAVHALPGRQSAHAFMEHEEARSGWRVVDDDSAAKGEAQRTVYVWATMESEAIDIATRAIEATDASRANELRKTWTGYTKHAVTLTATKVNP
jgi:hypothetical protein